MKILVRIKGGPGSGNHGHAGIPGSVGGSAPRMRNYIPYTEAKDISMRYGIIKRYDSDGYYNLSSASELLRKQDADSVIVRATNGNYYVIPRKEAGSHHITDPIPLQTEDLDLSWSESSGNIGESVSKPGIPGKVSKSIDTRCQELLDSNGIRVVPIKDRLKMRDVANHEVPESNIRKNTESIDYISSETGLNRLDVETALRTWITMNTLNADTLGMQQAASDEFDIQLTDRFRDVRSRFIAGENVSNREDSTFIGNRTAIMDSQVVRSVQRAMYNYTQLKLAEAGFKPGDTITLYRGIRSSSAIPAKGSEISYQSNVLDAWALNIDVANHFANPKNWTYYGSKQAIDTGGMVLTMKVPIESILSFPGTGYGDVYIGEVVVLGANGGANATVSRTY